MKHNDLAPLLNDRDALVGHVREKLAQYGLQNNLHQQARGRTERDSAVLLPLTDECGAAGHEPSDPCLVFNKRSRDVRQPGDLCFPGGSIAAWDKALAKLMRLSVSPLGQWRHWPQWRRSHYDSGSRLALLLTAGLREAWEEMRLNPLRVTFLGPLPAQRLAMFNRLIYPLAAWIPASQKLRPNWEVDRIVHIPIRQLLNPKYYGLYRLNVRYPGERRVTQKDFPCYLHQDGEGQEVLWGASFRITMDFLKLVFDYAPPLEVGMPVIEGRLKRSYLNGSRPSQGDKRTAK